jgi:hypothetical protein
MVRRTRILRALPWIGILVIIGTVQLIRDAPVDSIIFAVVAVLIVLDAVGVLPQPPAIPASFVGARDRRERSPRWLACAPRHGLLAGVVVSRGRHRSGRDRLVASRRLGTPRQAHGACCAARLWASVTVVLCLWELSSFLLGPGNRGHKNAHPAVSDLLDPAIDSWPGRIVFVAVWVAAMAGFVRAAQGRARTTTHVGSRP